MTAPAVIETNGEVPSEALSLFDTTDPQMVLIEAVKRADLMAEIVKERKLYKQIGEKAYVFVEGWQTLGSMCGVVAVEDGEAEPVEVEGVAGFKATYSAMRNGIVVGRATAYCMRDEQRWKGAEIHALAGMAQTRAISRALRGPLGFIMKLAGYDAAPAEEMRDAGDVADRLPIPEDETVEKPKTRGRK